MLTSYAWTLHVIAYLLSKYLIPCLDEDTPALPWHPTESLPTQSLFQDFLEHLVVRAFKSIQATPIQTHPVRCHGDSREGVCLYRSGLYRFKGPYLRHFCSE